MSSQERKRGVNVTVLALGLAMVIPLIVLFAYGFGTDQRAWDTVLEDKPAPGFQLVDLDGDPWSLEALEGKPAVINFWSTWCGPCKQEHPVLQRAAELYPEVQFLGVIYDDTPEKCRVYLERSGTTYDHLVDDKGRMAIDYGVTGVPETFFIDAGGTIIHKQIGPVNMQILAALLQPLVGP